MNKIVAIDLNQPFEHVLDAVLSLPTEATNGDKPASDAELKRLTRGLYEAANGRHVETGIGLVPIAPPVAEFLKAEPINAATQVEFLIDMATRIICGPNGSALRELTTHSNNHD
jgi:hypothetical protein